MLATEGSYKFQAMDFLYEMEFLMYSVVRFEMRNSYAIVMTQVLLVLSPLDHVLRMMELCN